MRVAFVVGQFPALSETFVLNQVTGLIDRGVEVDIYATERRPQSAVHPDVERYDLLAKTRYAKPFTGSDGARRMEVLRLALRALRRAGASPARVRQALRDGRLDANIALGFAHLSATPERYDVIHCHFGPEGTRGAAMRHVGILEGKVVTTFHGFDMSRYLQISGPNVYDRLFQTGDLFLPISDYWRSALVRMGCDPARIAVHHMGVDCDSFTFVPRTPPAAGEPLRLLSVGRFVEKKGFEYAMRAVARVASQYPSLEYTIIGEGPLHEELTALARELGIERHLRMVGSKPRDEVIATMNRAHVMLAPSVTAASGDQEGIPVVLMEAMATGLPVISTVHTGIPELVEDHGTGMLAPERDVETLAVRLTELVDTPSLYSSIATAARARVQREFDVDRLNDRLLELFTGLAR